MNPSQHKTDAASPASDSGVVIAIHFEFPALPRLALMLWTNTPQAFSQYGITLGFALRQAGLIEPSGGLGFHGTFRNGMILFRTQQRNEAIKLVREFIQSTCGDILTLDAPFTTVEIAHKTADGVWFTFEPKAHQIPFERWFEDGSKTEREDRSANADLWMHRFICDLVRHYPEPPRQFPS